MDTIFSCIAGLVALTDSGPSTGNPSHRLLSNYEKQNKHFKSNNFGKINKSDRTSK